MPRTPQVSRLLDDVKLQTRRPNPGVKTEGVACNFRGPGSGHNMLASMRRNDWTMALLVFFASYLGPSISSAAGAVVEVPATALSGQKVEVRVNPQPPTPSETVWAFAFGDGRSCPPPEGAYVQHGGGEVIFEAAPAGVAVTTSYEVVADPGTSITICAYQEDPYSPAWRYIGSAALTVSKPAGPPPKTKGESNIFFKPSPYTAVVKRPREIVPPLNGDPPVARNLRHWRKWGKPMTTARGVLLYNTCRPACVVGYHRAQGETVLSRIRRCSGDLRYTAVRFLYFRHPRYNIEFVYDCSGRLRRYG